MGRSQRLDCIINNRNVAFVPRSPNAGWIMSAINISGKINQIIGAPVAIR